MNRILSQDEIDALLTSVSDGKSYDSAESDYQDSDTAVTLYDFKHPDRISKEQIRTMRTIHENFARLFATFLSTNMRALVDVNVISIDQVTYSEYTMSLSMPSSLYLLKMPDLDGKAVVEISPQFLLFVVDRLLGGTGETEIEVREITIIEQNIVQRLINTLISMLNEVWNQIYPLNAAFDSFETDPQFVQIARSSETIAIIFFEIKVRGAVFPMNIGLPYFVLEPILQKLSSQTFFMNVKKAGESERKLLEERIQATKIPLKAIFSDTLLTVNEFLGLKRGDLILLDKELDDELQIKVTDNLKFFGVPGRRGRKLAIRITRSASFEEILSHE
ncbi:MAG: flagellar motor switch protein FliM [Candidatus Electryonea clarkiae]|nr:flagellar motor switch protein FliM [Candidatus Electryonea clarkiae]MDP8287311.1 flagellar motor switch protein FliM [Candidatus Electryonea clarkiae]